MAGRKAQGGERQAASNEAGVPHRQVSSKGPPLAERSSRTQGRKPEKNRYHVRAIGAVPNDVAERISGLHAAALGLLRNTVEGDPPDEEE